MLATVDIETQGLDATKFILGVLNLEEKKKTETYYNKKELWKRIIELGEKEKKRGKVLNLYGHNHYYDFAGYANLTDQNIQWFCDKPFIVCYKPNGKENIKFLDTMSIYNMSLKKVGEIIGTKKGYTPDKLKQKEKQKYTKEELKEIEKYCKQDTETTLEAIKHIKRKLDNDKISIKRYYSISQIAISYFMQKLRKMDLGTETQKKLKNGRILRQNHIFDDKQRGIVHRTLRTEEIHAAYRGGRVQPFKIGQYKNITTIDINNLYGYASTKIRFPDLRTERKHWKPKKEILKEIGVSKALIRNKTNRLGLLQVRTNTTNYYPEENKLIIGTWTNKELRKAEKEGYEIIAIEWTVTYQESENPYKKITPELYKKRIESKTEFDKYFYKQMMNRSYGKLAQRKKTPIIIVDTVEKAQEYLKKNFDVIQGLEYNYIYKKENTEKEKKNYYMPIIPCLINAEARIIMYEHYKKIPYEDLIYTDTDSISFKGEHINKFPINNNVMGAFKIEQEKGEMLIYGKKSYMNDKEVKAAGIRGYIEREDFKKGELKFLKMNTLKTTKRIKDVGTFTEETRNLKEQMNNYKEWKKLLDKQDIYIDHDITDISYFLKYLNM